MFVKGPDCKLTGERLSTKVTYDYPATPADSQSPTRPPEPISPHSRTVLDRKAGPC